MASSQTKTGKASRVTDSVGISERFKESTTVVLPDDQKKKHDLLWPEWSDADINVEHWGPASKKAGALPNDKKSKASTKTTATTKRSLAEVEPFEDPYPVCLPWSLQNGEITWVRPKVQFPNAKTVVFSPGSAICPDLLSNNRPLIVSEFMRSFICAVHTLCYLGYKNPFIVEWQTVQFSANTSNQPWKPWHHIYSMCKAGGSQSHNPLPNEIGKYVVRLYWLGCWRKIVVDDRYPVAATGHILLPTTYTGNDKELDLWPALLAKALMKIASLTWTDNEEIVDFDIITCLTGWNVQKIYTKGLDTMEIWDICKAYSDYYLYVKPSGPSEKPVLPGADKSLKSEKKKGKDSKSTKSSSKKTKNSGKKNAKSEQAQSSETSFYIVGSLSDLRKSVVISDEEDDLHPCYAHEFLIEQTKDIPLVKQIHQLVDTLSPWKMHRWLAWAKAHDISTPDPTLPNTKCLKIISNLRRSDEYNLYDLGTSELEKAIKLSVNVFHQFLTGIDPNEKEKEKEKKATSSKKEEKDKKKKVEFVDPSIWCSFKDIGPCIESISLYIKPSTFKIQYIISDLKLSGAQDVKTKKPSKTDDKKPKGTPIPVEHISAVKFTYLDNTVVKGKNEPLYMFIDSIDLKPVVFTLGYVGNDFPEPEIKKLPEENAGEKFACIIGPCIEGCICLDIKKKDSFRDAIFVDTRKRAHIIFENFNWKMRKMGDICFNMNTYGTNSLMLDLPKGRHVYRIWLQTSSPYALQIFAKVPFKVGKLEDILESMTTESELFIQTYYNICIGFANIVRCFGTIEYPAALKSFYKSYQPNVILNKVQRSQIHDAFIDEFVKLLKTNYPEDKHHDIIKTVKILFLNPRIKIPQPPPEHSGKKEVCMNNLSCICHEVDEEVLEAAAAKIQSFFKMIYFRKFKQHHNMQHKNFPKYLNLVKNIYVDIFSSKARDNTCPLLLRNLNCNIDLGGLEKYFTYYNDLDAVIDLQKFSGETIEFKSNVWIPLVKKVFYCNSPTPIWVRPVFYTSLSEYMLRIFNNETGEEIERLINCTMVAQYIYNDLGYTILVYASSNDSNIKPVNWKLYLMVERKLLTTCIDVVSSVNVSSYLQGNYIPNLDNLIFRCIVQYWTSSICTFHINTTSETVRIKFQCVSKKGNILAIGYGISNALLPTVNLIVVDEGKSELILDKATSVTRDKKDRTSKLSILSGSRKKKRSSADGETHILCNEVFLEAYVLEDTWPLTDHEWGTVERLKQRTSIAAELEQDSFSFTSDVTKFDLSSVTHRPSHNVTRKSKLKLNLRLEDPNWTLTNFTDSGKQVYVYLDLHRVEEIKDIKRECFDDANRYFDGLQIQKSFLDDHYIKWKANKYVETESFGEEDMNFNFTTFPDLETPPFAERKSVMSSGAKSVCAECAKPVLSDEELFLKAPESLHQMMAPFELNKADEINYEYRWPMSPTTEEKLNDKIYGAITNFEDKNQEFLDKMKTYLDSTRNSYNIFAQWFEGVRQDSANIMKMNETAREDLINKRRPGTDTGKGSKKGGKKKKK